MKMSERHNDRIDEKMNIKAVLIFADKAVCGLSSHSERNDGIVVSANRRRWQSVSHARRTTRLGDTKREVLGTGRNGSEFVTGGAGHTQVSQELTC